MRLILNMVAFESGQRPKHNVSGVKVNKNMFTPNFDLLRTTDCTDGIDAVLLEQLGFCKPMRPADLTDAPLNTDTFWEPKK